MLCPFCSFVDSKVIDSRPTDEGKTIRRRRSCLKCDGRFTTYEKIESIPISVIKKDGTRQLFERDKIIGGLTRASVNRPLSREKIEEIAEKIEEEVSAYSEKEISSQKIGELALSNLKNLDEVTYIRFASVTNRFSDIDSFLIFLKEMKKNK